MSREGVVAVALGLGLLLGAAVVVAKTGASASSPSASSLSASSLSASSPSTPAAASRVPAPASSLAALLGADDAGRGQYRYYEDGPACGSPPAIDPKRPLGAPATVSPTTLMGPLQSGAVGFFELTAAPRQLPRGAGPNKVRLILDGPKRATSYDAIALHLTLVNDDSRPLRYGRAVDGSFEHWRSPFVDVYLREEASSRVFRWAHGDTYGRCGNVNPRTAADFSTLEPGRRQTDPFDARSLTTVNVPVAGRYTMWTVYAACQGPELGGELGLNEPYPLDAFDGEIASDAIAIEIVP